MNKTYKIRNYTSSVPPERTIASIEGALSNAGALHIAKSYKDGEVVGFVFQLPVAEGRAVTFRLPCRVDPVEQILSEGIRGKTYRRGYNQRRQSISEQAKRTAWRLMYDWISVQLAMIKLGQAEAMEVFLPYAYDGRETFFETVRDSGYKLLSAPSDSDENE